MSHTQPSHCPYNSECLCYTLEESANRIVPENIGNLCVLIPAYVPASSLPDAVCAVLERPFLAVVVVNDGSPVECEPVFVELEAMFRVHVRRHDRNRGKGAALKTGLRYITGAFPMCEGVVTADADGQHHPEDIVRVAERLAAQPRTLVLGARRFSSGVPLRSRFGNLMARLALGATIGQWLQDAQTGLRGVPRELFSLLQSLPADRYDFESEMLAAAKHSGCGFLEVPVRTIYQAGNPSSHFRTIRDALSIFRTLVRAAVRPRKR
jgi:glycosyltransferase involved in cell wall biosynthesis